MKHQCSRDYFYGDNPQLEKAIQFVEGSYATVAVKELLSEGCKLNIRHKTILRRFWLLHLRTEAACKRAIEMNNEMGSTFQEEAPDFKIGIKQAVQMAMLTYADGMNIVDDLKVCLIKNKTKTKSFITSDDPAVLSNKWHLNDTRANFMSFGMHWLKALYSYLNPKVLCLCYDGDVYSISHTNGWVQVKSERDIMHFNQFQLEIAWPIYIIKINVMLIQLVDCMRSFFILDQKGTDTHTLYSTMKKMAMRDIGL